MTFNYRLSIRLYKFDTFYKKKKNNFGLFKIILHTIKDHCLTFFFSNEQKKIASILYKLWLLRVL